MSEKTDQVKAKDLLKESVALGYNRADASFDDLSVGTEVMYKSGREEGLLGLVVNVHKNEQAVDLKIGRSTRTMVKADQLFKLSRA